MQADPEKDLNGAKPTNGTPAQQAQDAMNALGAPGAEVDVTKYVDPNKSMNTNIKKNVSTLI